MHQMLQLNRIKQLRVGLLLPGLWGGLLWCLPVDAAQLKSWRFDQTQNQLRFTTDQAVSPRVQLIPDPTRLVVDLPGVTLGRPTVTQNVGAQFRSVRVGQFDAQTARIVVELAPGYIVDPAQVKVEGNSPTNWSIKLPEPSVWQQNSAASSSPTIASPTEASPDLPEAPESGGSAPPPVAIANSAPTAAEPAPQTDTVAAANRTTIRDLVVTNDGFFFKTVGPKPDVKLRNSRDRETVTLEVKDAAFISELRQKIFKPRYHGVESITLQEGPDPGMALITMKVNSESRGWRASVSKFSGIVLSPKRKTAGTRKPPSASSLIPRPTRTADASKNGQLATIRAIDLGGDQLLIRADGQLSYTQGWEGSTYRITVRSAQIAPGLRAPQVGLGSSLSEVRILQQDPTTVTILAKPASGVRILGLRAFNAQSLLLQLARSGAPARIPTANRPATVSPTPRPLPAVQGRPVIVIDPGHGGKDPGAIGIGGLRETDVVLDISNQVARILQQQGVVVRMTRSNETFVSLQGRVAYAERARATAFVSIHANAISLSRPDVNGLETYHAPGARLGSRLARTIHNTILRNISMGSRGVRSARFYVLRKSSMPAVLVETGFLTGRDDNPRLRNPAWRTQMAQSIAQGVLNYLSGRYN
ncbi:N-acetylmuramoyl-L-alanine amidase LytC [Acaryochloris thomasi RCC1774]|uniref:N-acetylmuramoyl-L-alanine amidase LytC n=1 Tax=Acaryochloris thomasi RCC1774 TaxID=1764569 RepID=A0A2W1JHX9_9CYAN|nr:N-acetylmuramoyl-L-alanine amidase [Acaryochloris thomasi]PZD72936.1 N-acetylmuramoyl-L-alanine amidase LytC [Acaryochloris thomasi RCC1774]